MKLRYIYGFTIILCSFFSMSWSQQVSDRLLHIISNDSLNQNQKITQFDSLIKNHQTEQRFDLLLGDRLKLSSWYYQQLNLDKAIECFELNIALMDSLSYDNLYFYRRNLYNLGYYQYVNSNIDNAVLSFKTLLKYDEQDKLTLRGTYYLAEINSSSSEYYQTLRYYEITNEIANKLNSNIYLIKSAIGIGDQCKIINKPKIVLKGINALKEAATLCENLNKDANLKNNIKDKYVYTIYNELGNLFTDRINPDFKNGEYYYNKAMEVAIKLNDSSKIGNTYNDIGQLYVSEKKEDALSYLEKALSYKNNTDDIINLSIINKNISRHYLTFKDYDKAFEYIQTSIALIIPFDNSQPLNLPNYNDLKKSNSKFYLCASLIEKAKIWIELAKEYPNDNTYYAEAIKTLKLADSLADQSRLESKERQSELFWRKTATEIYIDGVKVSMAVNNVEDAFYFIEKNKALLLLEDITLRNSRNNSDLPKQILDREIKLKHEISKLENVHSLNTKDQSNLLLAKDRYEQFIDSLDLKNRLYYKTLKPAKVIDLDVFKDKYLTKDNGYIQYILNKENGYGLLITKNESKLFEIKDVKTLKELTITYRALLDTPFKDRTSIENYKKISNAIYNALFPEDIRALITDKKLTISPDYYLQNIPFESLMTSTKDRSYLIFKNEISYVYSLTFLDENSKIERNNTKNLVGFAPVNFSSRLSQLPNTKEELNAIDQLFSSKMFLNEEATSETFFKESRDAKITHIASHANANDSISPWIAFHDSKVNLNELYNHNNSAELVVLSACNTSLGELYKGEGVMSLSRGFFNTGSHSVLPTLWEVNDKSSVELLSSFYTNLKAGESKSLALHNAKLEYLKTNSLSEASPYYWASFILIGDDSPIELNTSFNIYYYLILAALIGLIVFILKKRKKTKL